MAPSLLTLGMRIAAAPWYLGGAFTDDTLAILGHTGWQFLLLTYHTLSFFRDPLYWVQVFWAAHWFVEHYGMPDIPVPHPPQIDCSFSCSYPQLSVLGWRFDFHPLFSPPTYLHCPEPLATALVNAGCSPPSPLALPGGFRLLPSTQPPPLLPPLPGSPRSISLVEISLSFDFHFTLAPLRWWSLAELDFIAHVGPQPVQTNLPLYYQRWQQYYEMSKFFRELFAGGHMPMG